MYLIQYYPGETFLHRLDPRVKIIMLLALTAVIFIVKNFTVIAVIFCSLLALWIYARLPLKIITSYFKFFWSLLIFIIILQAFFYPGNTIIQPLIPTWVPLIGGFGRIYLDGVFFGFILGLRLLTLICTLPLVIMTTPVHQFSLGLVKMGLPYKIAFTATTALNLIPTLQSEMNTVTDAQKLRGSTVFEHGTFRQKIKAYPKLVLPLVIGSMRRAQLMGIAMDSRAFGTSPQRTETEQIKMQLLDWLTLALLFLYTSGALFFNFYW